MLIIFVESIRQNNLKQTNNNNLKLIIMQLTQKEKKVIENYLNYYYENHKSSNDRLPFKTQMNLLYNHLNYLVD